MPADGGGRGKADAVGRGVVRALNDARLALGARLEITDETSLEGELDEAVLRSPTSARVFQLTVYAYRLSAESLLEALTS